MLKCLWLTGLLGLPSFDKDVLLTSGRRDGRAALCGQGYSVLAFLESIQRQVDRERQGGAGPP